MSGDLVAFLRARLDEDEAAARESYYDGQRWITEEEGVYRWPEDELVHMADRKADARHIARRDPARVLREVEAGRKLLAAYDEAVNGHAADLGVADALEAVIRDRAAVYADHPDYRQEWKP